MRPDGPCQRCGNVKLTFSPAPDRQDRSVIVGPQNTPEGKTKGKNQREKPHPRRHTKDKRKNSSHDGPGPSSSPSLSTSLPVSPPLHSSRRAKGTILPTRVSRMKKSTAGARGLFHLHIFAILLPMTHAWRAHAGGLETGCNLDWRSPVSHHQYPSESIL